MEAAATNNVDPFALPGEQTWDATIIDIPGDYVGAIQVYNYDTLTSTTTIPMYNYGLGPDYLGGYIELRPKPWDASDV